MAELDSGYALCVRGSHRCGTLHLTFAISRCPRPPSVSIHAAPLSFLLIPVCKILAASTHFHDAVVAVFARLSIISGPVVNLYATSTRAHDTANTFARFSSDRFTCQAHYATSLREAAASARYASCLEDSINAISA